MKSVIIVGLEMRIECRTGGPKSVVLKNIGVRNPTRNHPNVKYWYHFLLPYYQLCVNLLISKFCNVWEL